jgi:DNA-binding NarL/FixJ family response regulator
MVPYLIDIPVHLLDGPLSQFQAISADKNGTKRVVEAIAEANPENRQDQRTLDKVFELWWPELERILAEVQARFPLPKVRRPEIRIFTSSDITILEQLAAGKRMNEIATAMGFSEQTLRVRVQQIVIKLNAANRAEAVELAKELDLI